jgi:hypothetical protein
MKNIYEVLRQKESELQQLQKDIEALRVAARLLADESEADSMRSVTSAGSTSRVSVAGAVAAAVKPADTLGPAAGIRQFP